MPGLVIAVKRPPEAFVSANLSENGMGHVVVSRFKLDGTAEVGVFLLDVYCLGVKDAFFTRLEPARYDREFLERTFRQDGRESLEPACARKWVEDAVAYARRLGFEPHPDYKLGARVFGGIEAAACTRTFQFGREGKPLYIQGPHDSPQRVDHILATLRRTCGEGNFHFIILGGSPEELKSWLEPE